MPTSIPTPHSITRPQFDAALSRYASLLTKVSEEKASKNASKGGAATLSTLDTFRFVTAPEKYGVDLSLLRKIESNGGGNGNGKGKSTGGGDIPIKPLEKADLVKLVEWKLKHGTFRPALLAHASSNAEEIIKSASEAAVRTLFPFISSQLDPPQSKTSPPAQVKAVSTSLTHLTKPLKGIGPATASLILSVYFPSLIPFFSDEVFYWLCLCLCGSGNAGSGGKESGSEETVVTVNVKKGWKAGIKYNVKEYEALVGAWCGGGMGGGLRSRKGFEDVEAVDVERVAWVLVREGEGDGQAQGLGQAQTQGGGEKVKTEVQEENVKVQEGKSGKRSLEVGGDDKSETKRSRRRK